MNIWKQKIVSVLYFHYRWFVMGIIAIGACVAFAVVYRFLFTKVVVDLPQEPTISVTVNQQAVERVATWNTTMAQKGAIQITIPNTGFAIPTPPPD